MERAPFISVANFQHLERVLKKYMNDSGVSPAGLEFNVLLYKAMHDVDKDNAGMSTFEKNRLAVEIVARFVTKINRPAFEDPIADEPIPERDIARRMADMESSRTDVDLGDPHKDFLRAVKESEAKYGSKTAVHRPDLMGLRRNVGSKCDPPWAVGGLPGDAMAGKGSGSDGPDGAGDIIPKPKGPKRLVRRYLMINGYDRQWSIHPLRFKFQVNLAQSDANLKDIRSIAATHLVIPREIVEEKSITNVNKTRFEHAFGLQYPYLILRITDFQNVYRSTNSASSNAFAHFVYKDHYTGPNGRGYIHLKPIQSETLTFEVNTLASLEQLDLAVQRPSGELLNTSRDETRVINFQHMNIVNINTHLILVTLQDYFDRNEYFTGDTVRFTDFQSPSTALALFINRESGHEILEYGTPNSNGYTNSFYIRVPGELNKSTGVFDTDVALTNLLSGGVSVPGGHVALVINASLQFSVSFDIRVEEENVTV